MRWTQCRRDAHCRPSHKPGVVVAVSGREAYHTLSVMERTYGFRETFASLTLVETTVSASLSVLAAHVSLRGILTREADRIRERCVESRVLYSLVTKIRPLAKVRLAVEACGPLQVIALKTIEWSCQIFAALQGHRLVNELGLDLDALITVSVQIEQNNSQY
jgi:hypothetical protein